LTSLAEHKDGGSLGFRCLTMYGHCKWCPTWTCSNGGKGITPLGTKANPRGKCSVKHFRSVWGHRVTLHAITPLDTAATQSGRLLKLDADEVLVVDMTDLSSKSVADVLAILLFLRANESDARRVVQETAAEGMTARLSLNRSLVHSGLNLDSLSKHPAREDGRPAGTAPSSGGGGGGSDGVFNDHGGPGEGQRLGGGGDDGVAVPVGGDELGYSGGLACTAGAVGSLQRAARSARDGAPGPAAGNAAAQPSAGVRGAPGGARGDCDGILEDLNVAVSAAYYMRMMRASVLRARRLEKRRASSNPPPSRQLAPSDDDGDFVHGAGVAAIADSTKRAATMRKSTPSRGAGALVTGSATCGAKLPFTKRRKKGPTSCRGSAASDTAFDTTWVIAQDRTAPSMQHTCDAEDACSRQREHSGLWSYARVR